jgi:hypothetical protein
MMLWLVVEEQQQYEMKAKEKVDGCVVSSERSAVSAY